MALWNPLVNCSTYYLPAARMDEANPRHRPTRTTHWKTIENEWCLADVVPLDDEDIDRIAAMLNTCNASWATAPDQHELDGRPSSAELKV